MLKKFLVVLVSLPCGQHLYFPHAGFMLFQAPHRGVVSMTLWQLLGQVPPGKFRSQEWVNSWVSWEPRA
eukprot:6457402-Amphidinium_carterae.1